MSWNPCHELPASLLFADLICDGKLLNFPEADRGLWLYLVSDWGSDWLYHYLHCYRLNGCQWIFRISATQRESAGRVVPGPPGVLLQQRLSKALEAPAQPPPREPGLAQPPSLASCMVSASVLACPNSQILRRWIQITLCPSDDRHKYHWKCVVNQAT
jgi:hypothetical protein